MIIYYAQHVFSYSGYKRISSKVERYNPLNDHWEARRPLSMPRFFAMLVATGNKLLLFGGATLDQAGDVVCAKQVLYICIWHSFECDMGLDGTLTSHIERVADEFDMACPSAI